MYETSIYRKEHDLHLTYCKNNFLLCFSFNSVEVRTFSLVLAIITNLKGLLYHKTVIIIVLVLIEMCLNKIFWFLNKTTLFLDLNVVTSCW